MSSQLTTISVTPEIRDYARAHKREDETWAELVETLVEESSRSPGGDRE